MANNTIGECACPFCQEPADVRKNVKGKVYLYCDNCGMIQPNLAGGQDWILANARLFGPDGQRPPMPPVAVPEQEPVAVPVAVPAPVAVPEPEPEPVAARDGLDDWFN